MKRWPGSLARLNNERGAILVLSALLLVALLGTVALVVDLAALRTDVRLNQLVSDFSATSGAFELDPDFGGSPYAACMSAWAYFLANSPEAPSGTPDPCGAFATSGSFCVPDTPVVVSATAGPYEVTITQPVPNDSPLLKTWLDPDIDGDPCERIGVTISRTRGFIFGPAIGAVSGLAGAGAVARAAAGTAQPELVPLLVLDPTGCKALVAKGQAKVLVSSAEWVEEGERRYSPGVIVVDSSGTEKNAHPERNCSNSNDFVIDPFGEQNSQIEAADALDADGAVVAKGTIYSFALMPGQGNSFAYDPSDVASGRLKPQPVPGNQIGRTPFDVRYNCKPSVGCDDKPPYIDNLRGALGGTGPPAGYLEYGPGPTADYVGPCQTQPGTPPINLSGNWWINCPTGLRLSSSMTIEGGSVVFEAGVNVGSSTGILTINGTGVSDVVVFFRSGHYEKDAQASVVMGNPLGGTMVYLENGRIDFGAGTGTLTWIAPFSGNFEDLALWSESVYEHKLGGQANLNIEGAFFTPNASPFNFAGQGLQYQTKAQFVTYRLLVTGQGVLRMQPDPERSVPILVKGVRLIR